MLVGKLLMYQILILLSLLKPKINRKKIKFKHFVTKQWNIFSSIRSRFQFLKRAHKYLKKVCAQIPESYFRVAAEIIWVSSHLIYDISRWAHSLSYQQIMLDRNKARNDSRERPLKIVFITQKEIDFKFYCILK